MMSGLNKSQGKATPKLTKLARMTSSSDVIDQEGVHERCKTASAQYRSFIVK